MNLSREFLLRNLHVTTGSRLIFPNGRNMKSGQHNGRLFMDSYLILHGKKLSKFFENWPLLKEVTFNWFNKTSSTQEDIYNNVEFPSCTEDFLSEFKNLNQFKQDWHLPFLKKVNLEFGVDNPMLEVDSHLNRNRVGPTFRNINFNRISFCKDNYIYVESIEILMNEIDHHQSDPTSKLISDLKILSLKLKNVRELKWTMNKMYTPNQDLKIAFREFFKCQQDISVLSMTLMHRTTEHNIDFLRSSLKECRNLKKIILQSTTSAALFRFPNNILRLLFELKSLKELYLYNMCNLTAFTDEIQDNEKWEALILEVKYMSLSELKKIFKSCRSLKKFWLKPYARNIDTDYGYHRVSKDELSQLLIELRMNAITIKDLDLNFLLMQKSTLPHTKCKLEELREFSESSLSQILRNFPIETEISIRFLDEFALGHDNQILGILEKKANQYPTFFKAQS